MKKSKMRKSSEIGDPFGWIVLSLERKDWFKGQIIVEQLKEKITWSEKNGEITLKENGEILSGTNIAHIVRHAVDQKTPKPHGYSDVVKYMLSHGKDPEDSKDPEQNPNSESDTIQGKVVQHVMSHAKDPKYNHDRKYVITQTKPRKSSSTHSEKKSSLEDTFLHKKQSKWVRAKKL